MLKTNDIAALADVSRNIVIGWIERGHPTVGKLRAANVCMSKKQKRYRVEEADWQDFWSRMQQSVAEAKRGGVCKVEKPPLDLELKSGLFH